jgi:membrane-associated HD superfamily phosphohydrolase
MTEERKAVIVPMLVVIVMLLLAIPSMWPYGYYVLLRWVVCGVSIFIAVQSYNWGRKIWMATMGLIALLFNPLIPVHLDKETWVFLDAVVALVYSIGVFTIKKGKQLK